MSKERTYTINRARYRILIATEKLNVLLLHKNVLTEICCTFDVIPLSYIIIMQKQTHSQTKVCIHFNSTSSITASAHVESDATHALEFSALSSYLSLNCYFVYVSIH